MQRSILFGKSIKGLMLKSKVTNKGPIRISGIWLTFS